MIENINQIVSAFKKAHPNLIITRVIDYDKTHCVVEAVETLGNTDYSDPYYAVNKATGQVSYFLPMHDISKFMDAVRNRTVYKR